MKEAIRKIFKKKQKEINKTDLKEILEERKNNDEIEIIEID